MIDTMLFDNSPDPNVVIWEHWVHDSGHVVGRKGKISRRDLNHPDSECWNAWKCCEVRGASDRDCIDKLNAHLDSLMRPMQSLRIVNPVE